MKIFIKYAAILAALLGSGLTQAANTTASIPMDLEVPRSCALSNVSSGLVLPEDGSETQGSITVTCNIDGGFQVIYSLDSISTKGTPLVKNATGFSLPISAQIQSEGWTLPLTTSIKGLNYNFSWLNRPSLGVIKVSLINPTTATTPAGIYTDTFRVNVNY